MGGKEGECVVGERGEGRGVGRWEGLDLVVLFELFCSCGGGFGVWESSGDCTEGILIHLFFHLFSFIFDISF